MPFTIAAKAAFLVAMTWFPVGHPQHGLVEHRYEQEFPSAAACFEEAQRRMEPESMGWTKADAGCTYQPPIGKNMTFYIPERDARDWESVGFFIIPG